MWKSRKVEELGSRRICGLVVGGADTTSSFLNGPSAETIRSKLSFNAKKLNLEAASHGGFKEQSFYDRGGATGETAKKLIISTEGEEKRKKAR